MTTATSGTPGGLTTSSSPPAGRSVPVEVERTLLQHADVVEAAVIGVPDDLRGAIVKAVLVADRNDQEFVTELQNMVREQLSPHEYPREIEFVDTLPKTPNGKVNRRALRDVARPV